MAGKSCTLRLQKEYKSILKVRCKQCPTNLIHPLSCTNPASPAVGADTPHPSAPFAVELIGVALLH